MSKRANHDRNFEWGSLYGNKLLKDMDDLHVVNVTHLLQTRVKNYSEMLASEQDPGRITTLEYALENNTESLNTFLAEMDYRGITKDSLQDAPYPFKSPDGDLLIWDYVNRCPKVFPNSITFIKED